MARSRVSRLHGLEVGSCSTRLYGACWLVTELFSRLLKEAKVEQGERARGSSTHVRLPSGLIHTSTLDTVAGSTPRSTTT